VSYEPVSSAFTELSASAAEDSCWECHKLALSDQDGIAPINVASGTDLSSFLAHKGKNTEPSIDYVGREDVRTARLDSLQLVEPGDPTLMKLDVQGFEDRVLAGASATLARIDLIECELSLVSLYDDQPTLRDMVDLLDDLGYLPIGLSPNYVDHAARVVDVDGLFERRHA
jgi:FkbM family methyltransferase